MRLILPHQPLLCVQERRSISHSSWGNIPPKKQTLPPWIPCNIPIDIAAPGQILEFYPNSFFIISNSSQGLQSTSSIFSWDARIWGDPRWWFRGNWSLSDQSKPIFGPGWSLESIYWPQIALESPPEVTLDYGIQGHHAGGVAHGFWLEIWFYNLIKLFWLQSIACRDK